MLYNYSIVISNLFRSLDILVIMRHFIIFIFSLLFSIDSSASDSISNCVDSQYHKRINWDSAQSAEYYRVYYSSRIIDTTGWSGIQTELKNLSLRNSRQKATSRDTICPYENEYDLNMREIDLIFHSVFLRLLQNRTIPFFTW